MGLIGSILAEGAAGAAEGLGQGGAAVGKEWTAALHEKAKQEAIALREENLARLNNSAAAERQQSGFGHAEKMERDIRQPFDKSQQEARFGNEKTLQEARLTYDRERDAASRTLSREQIASHEKISAANNNTALQVAKIGGSVTQDTQGNVLWVGKDGKAQQIMDPSNPDKPLTAYKDLTPAAKAYADVLKAQLIDLDKQEANAMTDDKAKATITERRARLNADLLNVLTGGIGAAGKEETKPSGKTGWDSSSGKVYANGRELGTAKTEAEARKMVANPPAAAAAQPAVSGRPLYNRTTTELTRIAARPKGTSAAEAEDAQHELDTRRGESRLGAG